MVIFSIPLTRYCRTQSANSVFFINGKTEIIVFFKAKLLKIRRLTGKIKMNNTYLMHRDQNKLINYDWLVRAWFNDPLLLSFDF